MRGARFTCDRRTEHRPVRGARFTCDRRAPWECFVVVCFVRFVVAASFVVFFWVWARAERFPGVTRHHEPRLGFLVWVYSCFCES